MKPLNVFFPLVFGFKLLLILVEYYMNFPMHKKFK